MISSLVTDANDANRDAILSRVCSEVNTKGYSEFDQPIRARVQRYPRFGIAILTVTSPIVINVPTRGLLAVETEDSFVLWLAKFKYQKTCL